MVRYVSNIDGNVVLYGENGDQYAFGTGKGTPLSDEEASALKKHKYQGRQIIVTQKGGNA